MGTFQLFRGVFYAGLCPPAAILFFQSQQLMPLLLYIGVFQIGLLALLSIRLEAHAVPLAIDTLHKAGFLHTLFAVGGAVVLSGQILASSTFTAESMSRLLLPMGAALLPHALGVMAGHALQMRPSSLGGEDATEAEALLDLRRQREQLLKQTVHTLREEQKLLREVHTELEKQPGLLRAVSKSLTGFADPIRETLTAVEGVVSTLKRNMADLNREMESIKEAAQKTCSAMEGGATATKKMVAFVGDVEKFQRLVVERLEKDLFTKRAA